MNFKEKVVIKQKAYTEAGFVCSEPVITDDSAFFFSDKDGIKRKHNFTESTMAVEVVSEEKIPEIIEPVKEEKVEEVVQPTIVEEPKPKKKTTKKKKGE